LIIGVVRESHGLRLVQTGRLGEKLIAGNPSGFFQGPLFPPGRFSDIHPFRDKREMVMRRQGPDELLVAIGLGAAQQMIEVGDNEVEPILRKRGKDVQKRHGIGSPGNGRQHRIARGKEPVFFYVGVGLLLQDFLGLLPATY
jgi:hypothetical protein